MIASNQTANFELKSHRNNCSNFFLTENRGFEKVQTKIMKKVIGGILLLLGIIHADSKTFTQTSKINTLTQLFVKGIIRLEFRMRLDFMAKLTVFFVYENRTGLVY